VFPVRYKRGFYIQEDGVLHSHRPENLKSYMKIFVFRFIAPCNPLRFMGLFGETRSEH
jgi:hypothetical protein